MSMDSHLPVFSPDDEIDILHGTQLVLMHTPEESSNDLNSMKIAAYVSGKMCLYIVSIEQFKLCFYCQVCLWVNVCGYMIEM